MPINTETIKTVRMEMWRLDKRLKELEDEAEINHAGHYWAPKQTGAVRRASMDLTRTLADLRRT